MPEVETNTEATNPPNMETFFKQVLEGYKYVNAQINSVERSITVLQERGFNESSSDGTETPVKALKEALAKLQNRKNIFETAQVIFNEPLSPTEIGGE